jgi:hypothetical protein
MAEDETNTTETLEEPQAITVDDISFPGDEAGSLNPYEESTEPEKEEVDEVENVESEEATEVAPEETDEVSNETENLNHKEESTDEEYFSSLSEITGREVKSDDDIVTSLKRVSELESELEALKSDPFGGYDPIVRDIAAATKANMDVNTFMSAKNLNVEALDGKAALLEKYKLDNSEAFKRDANFAQKRFERDFASKYSAINKALDPDDFETDIDYQNALDDQEFSKSELSDSVAIAKQDLSKWQKENTTIVTPTGLSDEEVTQRIESYNREVDSTLSNLKGLSIPVGDKNFTFDLGVEGLKEVKAGLLNPEQTVRDVFGIDLEKGSIDSAKLAKALVFQSSFNNGKLGDSLKTFALESFNKETLAAKEVNPARANTPSGLPDSMSEKERVANAFAAQRNKGYEYNPYK